MSCALLARTLDALEVEAPLSVNRGRSALAKVLGWTKTTAWSDVAWSFSDLAGGSPVELIWRPGRPGLYWTAEPAAPEWTTRRRCSRAFALAGMLGARFGAADRAALRDIAEASAGPWPIWIGGRHDADGDTFKIYALTDAISAPVLRGDDTPVMLGLSAKGSRELYWRRNCRHAGDRWRMAQQPRLAPMVSTLDRTLRQWTGYGLDDAQAGRIGLSVRWSLSGEAEALAAFLPVRHAGGADNVRRRLLAQGGEANPAMAQLWADRRLSPMFLTLAATPHCTTTAIGFRLIA